MRQRVLVALGTFLHPQIVLADEPTTALDVVIQKSILLMLMDLQQRMKNSLVIVSHDMGVHYQITNRIAIMYAGKIVEVGPTEQVFNNPLHPLYADADPVAAACRRPGRAQGHQRSPAQPDRSTAGLPLRCALPLRDGSL